jgi:hypothetical protein
MAQLSQPNTQVRHAPARGKPGVPKGAESPVARRTPKSAATTRVRNTNAPRKKRK